MRLVNKNLRLVYLRRKQSGKDKQGYALKGWSKAVPLLINLQPAGGSINAQIYGENLNYMLSGKYQGNLLKSAENEGDGLCVDAEPEADPDYEIVAIQENSTHKNISLKRRNK